MTLPASDIIGIQTVLEVGPGMGLYPELLAPTLAKDGMYVATNLNPPAILVLPYEPHGTDYEGQQFDGLLRAAPSYTASSKYRSARQG